MIGKRFAIVLSAAILAAVSLSSCSGGKPIRSVIPEINKIIESGVRPTGSPVKEMAQEQSSQAPTEAQGRLVTEGKKAYYYIGDELQKGGIVGNDADGYYFADAQGVIDLGYCDGVNANGADWNVIEGKAKAAESESDKVLFLALQTVAKYTKPDMSREEKLRACFDHIKTDYLEGVRHDPPYQEIDWPIVYANDIFVYGKGDCFSYGAAFAYIGKAIGFEKCYACNSGGHGWAEIDGLYYDPEWDMHHTDFNHYGVAPDDPCDVDYVHTIMDGVDWMRVKI